MKVGDHRRTVFIVGKRIAAGNLIAVVQLLDYLNGRRETG